MATKCQLVFPDIDQLKNAVTSTILDHVIQKCVSRNYLKIRPRFRLLHNGEIQFKCSIIGYPCDINVTKIDDSCIGFTCHVIYMANVIGIYSIRQKTFTNCQIGTKPNDENKFITDMGNKIFRCPNEECVHV